MIDDRATGATLAECADRWPASAAYVGGFTGRMMHHARIKAGEFAGGSGSRRYYTETDIRRYVLRHAIWLALGSRLEHTDRLNDALDNAGWPTPGRHTIIDLGDVAVYVNLPFDVWVELNPNKLTRIEI